MKKLLALAFASLISTASYAGNTLSSPLLSSVGWLVVHKLLCIFASSLTHLLSVWRLFEYDVDLHWSLGLRFRDEPPH